MTLFDPLITVVESVPIIFPPTKSLAPPTRFQNPNSRPNPNHYSERNKRFFGRIRFPFSYMIFYFIFFSFFLFSQVDEKWVLPAVLQLGGEPIVTEDGDIIYRFPVSKLSTLDIAAYRMISLLILWYGAIWCDMVYNVVLCCVISCYGM